MPIYFNLSQHILPLTVDSIGNHWNQESVHRSKGFPHYHWLQTEQGVGEVVIADKKLELNKGMGVLIAPFVPHAYRANQPGWHTCFITFSGKLESQISNIVGHERYILISYDTDFFFQKWIDNIISAHESQQLDPIQLSVGCYAFLMNINSSVEYRDYLNDPLYQRYILPIIKEIEINYHDDITVQSLADAVFITPQYLSRLWKRFLGCSTYMYLTNYRIIKAKELLANQSELAISEISFRVGYHDTSHFIAMFKSVTGYTPLEFRRLHR